MNKTYLSAIGILLVIAGYLFGTLLFETTAQQSHNESRTLMISE
jgi:hypothetical protein